MSYEVLARKWRPQRFSELVGQEHISRTLKNAIARQRVAHAYLFVGSRGVGKTTSARLFAKSLNCTDLVDGEPCCKCLSCLEITAGNSLDVIEIDGASNNGVDSIRELRENVQYTPSSGNYKIYVIDEVHMLTAAAWNALLKTLEEPPPHVKFIFATTEAHKVLPTVVSRCQRFDFKQIPPTLIVGKLRQIADAEGIHIDDSALSAIARAADGGMRDAQSIFDQMIAFCGGSTADELITENDVIDVFGLASTAELARLCGSLLVDDISGVMVAVNALSERGRDLDRLFSDLMNLFRNLMIVQLCKEAARIIEVTEGELLVLKELAKADPQITRTLLESLMKEDSRLRQALNKRVFFEVCLVRAMHEAHAININDVIARFDEIKNRGHELQLPDALKQKESFNIESIMASLEGLQASPVSVPSVETSEKKTADSVTLPSVAPVPSSELAVDAVEVAPAAISLAVPPVTMLPSESAPSQAEPASLEPVSAEPLDEMSELDEMPASLDVVIEEPTLAPPISEIAGGSTPFDEPIQEVIPATNEVFYGQPTPEMPSVADLPIVEAIPPIENLPSEVEHTVSEPILPELPEPAIVGVVREPYVQSEPVVEPQACPLPDFEKEVRPDQTQPTQLVEMTPIYEPVQSALSSTEAPSRAPVQIEQLPAAVVENMGFGQLRPVNGSPREEMVCEPISSTNPPNAVDSNVPVEPNQSTMEKVVSSVQHEAGNSPSSSAHNESVAPLQGNSVADVEPPPMTYHQADADSMSYEASPFRPDVEVPYGNVVPVQQGTVPDNAVMVNSEPVCFDQKVPAVVNDFIAPAVKAHNHEQFPADSPVQASAHAEVPTVAETSHWNINELWHNLLNSMAQVPGGQLLHNYMQEAKPVSFANGVFVSELSDDFPVLHFDTLTSFDNSAVINRVLQRVTGVNQSSVNFIKTSETFLDKETRSMGATPEVLKRVTENPFVKNVCQVFGGEVIDARG